jgi:hypothetical protein
MAAIALPTPQVAPEVAAEVRTASSAPGFRELPRAVAPADMAEMLIPRSTAAVVAPVAAAPVATALS